MTKPQRFKAGDVVEWTSSAAGVVKTKRGVVVAIVATEQDPLEVLERVGKGRGAFGEGMPRSHESYLVEVSSPRPSIYWPRVTLLRRGPRS